MLDDDFIVLNKEKDCWEFPFERLGDALDLYELEVSFRGRNYFISSVTPIGWAVLCDGDRSRNFNCATRRQFEETATIDGVPLREAWPEIRVEHLC